MTEALTEAGPTTASASTETEKPFSLDDLSTTMRDLDSTAPFRWLERGWSDLVRSRGIGLVHGLLFALVGYTVLWGSYSIGQIYLVLPLVMGFALIGPFLATGLYDVSRRLEAGEPVSLGASMFAWRSPLQVGLMGAALMLILFAWVRLAALLFMLHVGVGYTVTSVEALVSDTIFTAGGLGFLAFGTAAGALMAALTFSVSAVSIPMIIDRDVDAITASISSIATVKSNLAPMILWAMMVSLLTVVGLATGLLGLIVIFPLLGHATWHAYRDSFTV